MYVSTDEFSVNGPELNGAQIYAVVKGDLLAGRANANTVEFGDPGIGDLGIGGTGAAFSQPATNADRPRAERRLDERITLPAAWPSHRYSCLSDLRRSARRDSRGSVTGGLRQ